MASCGSLLTVVTFRSARGEMPYQGDVDWIRCYGLYVLTIEKQVLYSWLRSSLRGRSI